MGLNYLIRADGRLINLGPKTAVDVAPGVSVFADFFYILYFIAILTFL